MATSNCLAAAAVRLTLRYPFWTEVFYSMEVVEDTVETETAATDGRKFWVNPEWWAKHTLDEAVGVVAHEVAHKILLHCTRRGNRDPDIWNAACDFAVNALLLENKFTLPRPHLHDPKYVGLTAEAIYADLVKQQKANQARNPSWGDGLATDGKGRPIPGVPKAWEAIKDVRQATGSPEAIEKMETEVKALVDRALANAKARGSVPMGIEAGVVDVYKASQESWFNHLHRYMQSVSTSEYNWARLNRRTLRTHGVFSPLHLSEALGEVAVFIDTSGSCFDAAEQANFMGHLNAIMAEAKPQRIHLYSFDAQVYPAAVLEAGEMELPRRLRGGGGTRFEPIFEQLEADGVVPEVVLILTDLAGSFPAEAPAYPVVWCSVVAGEEAPFGDTIHVE